MFRADNQTTCRAVLAGAWLPNTSQARLRKKPITSKAWLPDTSRARMRKKPITL